METILNYLDNMFASYEQTPEVLRAKEDLAEMMEDKYNELTASGKIENEAIGIVISEFGNIQELAEELEIKTNRKETERKESSRIIIEEKQDDQKDDEGFSDTGMRHLSDMEAEEYLFIVKQSSISIAAGVFLCICSPVLIILLGAIQDFMIPISDGIAVGAGVTVLLCMVACAVGLFITSGMKLDKYDYLKNECFIINEQYKKEIIHLRESRKGNFTAKITAGVIMCILSVIPLILVPAVLDGEKDFPVILSVIFLMVIVASAVSLFITAGMEEESYKVILQEKEFSIKKKAGKKIENVISAIYWPVIVIAYLAWSFICGGWGYTWIIWPIAGIRMILSVRS